MTNDKPTSLRMGFGYGQARSAGLGGVLAPRSPRQVNRIIRGNKSAREATEALREAAKDSDWVRLIKHRVADGQTPEAISEEIYWIERYARARKRFSLAWCLRHHWPYSN
jgi:hypothetical protein